HAFAQRTNRAELEPIPPGAQDLKAAVWGDAVNQRDIGRTGSERSHRGWVASITGRLLRRHPEDLSQPRGARQNLRTWPQDWRDRAAAEPARCAQSLTSRSRCDTPSRRFLSRRT